jgi:hypothetical protein
MAHPLLELTNKIVTRIEVLLSKAMEKTVFEDAFIDRTLLVKNFLAFPIFSICKIIARVAFILCVMLSIALQSSFYPSARVPVSISESSLALSLELTVFPTTSNNLIFSLKCPLTFKMRSAKVSRVFSAIWPYEGTEVLSVVLPLPFKAGAIKEFLNTVSVSQIILPLTTVYHVRLRRHRLQLLFIISRLCGLLQGDRFFWSNIALFNTISMPASL